MKTAFSDPRPPMPRSAHSSVYAALAGNVLFVKPQMLGRFEMARRLCFGEPAPGRQPSTMEARRSS